MKEKTVLITADGHTLLNDMEKFDNYGIKHDIFCVNRSIRAIKKPVNHWAAIDSEEAMWLMENLPAETISEGHKIGRHTIGLCPGGYDVFWQIDEATPADPRALLMWCGSTTYFALLASVWMGYEKIIVAGAPLDRGPHWYDPPDNQTSPKWVGEIYTTWMDFAKTADAQRTRALSGYSAFILGEPTEEWLNGHGK